MIPPSNDNKEWSMNHDAALSGSAVNGPAPPNYSSSPSMAQPYPYGQPSMMPPPGLSYPPPHMHTTFMSTVKNEADPRLPGMMMMSQPGTPRPNAMVPEDNAPSTSKKSRQFAPYTSINPYPTLPRRTRTRSDNSMFSAETSPSFAAAKPLDNLYSHDRTNLLTVRIQSKMDRGFFLADNDWTCYRRNYFQVSSTFSIHGLNPYYGDHELQCFVQTLNHGIQPVARFVVGITARVSTNDKPVNLVQHTPKRDKGPQMTPQPKIIVPGGNLSLSSVGANQSIATFERIQFKTATANNGKRRAAQQYYVVVVELSAETHDGEHVLIASSLSSPLVVRGRSPGHYADNQNRSQTSLATGSHLPPPLGPEADAASAASMMMPPHVDDRYQQPQQGYNRPNPMMPTDYQHYYYGSYASNAPPTPAPAPYPPSMMMHPSQSSSSATSQTMHPQTSAVNDSTSSSVPAATSSPPSHHHGLSDPSSSESSSPDIYPPPLSATSSTTSGSVPAVLHDKGPHPSQISIQSMPVDNNWSRSRYHSTGSVPSPVGNGDQGSYFIQQQPPNGAPPTPTTPFSRKFDHHTTEQTS
ncbi:p53-like transcription factor [Hesseltinella vesiculosa]|uniref:p53-like transcription factor n=1 Tax=Hesseltinella vesiculosa TaxID=101127 RepID=A0A1X2GJA6_9FUNG|nr:p53-like transcription factor [Hesseltinella vesiculosa]